jgi:hypothetical protein
MVRKFVFLLNHLMLKPLKFRLKLSLHIGVLATLKHVIIYVTRRDATHWSELVISTRRYLNYDFLWLWLFLHSFWRPLLWCFLFLVLQILSSLKFLGIKVTDIPFQPIFLFFCNLLFSVHLLDLLLYPGLLSCIFGRSLLFFGLLTGFPLKYLLL